MRPWIVSTASLQTIAVKAEARRIKTRFFCMREGDILGVFDTKRQEKFNVESGNLSYGWSSKILQLIYMLTITSCALAITAGKL
jgi:hypothetical protein